MTMKTAVVNGQEISAEAVNFELDRLVRFYMGHGMTMAEVRQNLPKLEAKALDQAIGAKLLLDQAARLDIPVAEKDIDAEVARVVQQVGGEENYKKALAAQGISEADFRKELEKGARVNMLVNQACAHVADPTEDEVTSSRDRTMPRWTRSRKYANASSMTRRTSRKRRRSTPIARLARREARSAGSGAA